MKFTIIGGGIAGLSFAYEALKKNHKIKLIEKSKFYGGLCRSFKKNNCILDLGVHLFHGKDERVMALTKEVVDESLWVHVSRIGKLYISGRHISWPINFKSLFQFPLNLSMKIFFDQMIIFLLRKKNKKKESNYENEILGIYGRTLFHKLFKPLTEKFFKLKSNQIHSDWAFSSIRSATKIEDQEYKNSNQYLIHDTSESAKKSFNIFRFIYNQLIDSFKKENFYYFKKGYGTLAQCFVNSIKRRGGVISLNSSIEKIQLKNRNISSIFINGKEEKIDHMIWTGSLENLCDLLNIKKPEVKRLNSKFVYVFLKKCLKKHQVCYYADKDISFVRGTILSNHYTGIINNKNIDSLLCLEYTSLNFESQNNKITKKDYQVIIKDLIKVGLVDTEEDIYDIFALSVPNTYPIFTKNYQSEISRVKKQISKINNLTLFGRQGSFSYENADGLILDAMNHSLLK